MPIPGPKTVRMLLRLAGKPESLNTLAVLPASSADLGRELSFDFALQGFACRHYQQPRRSKTEIAHDQARLAHHGEGDWQGAADRVGGGGRRAV